MCTWRGMLFTLRRSVHRAAEDDPHLHGVHHGDGRAVPPAPPSREPSPCMDDASTDAPARHRFLGDVVASSPHGQRYPHGRAEAERAEGERPPSMPSDDDPGSCARDQKLWREVALEMVPAHNVHELRATGLACCASDEAVIR
jgi:hypothetical protein